MKIQAGKQSFNLNKNHFLSQGGEGSVYVKGDLAYKIYHDRNNIVPLAKIDELKRIQDDRVIKPLDLIYNRNKPVGYSMRFVRNTYPLCKIFTKAFKTRHSLSQGQVLNLIKGMKESVEKIHAANILIVDCNELNFLISEDFKEVYFIDVDSYQTLNFKATAIMESIRDRHSKHFSELTDWFSWGIITFQMMTGIHPYKGRHPTVKTLDERMQANLSVFNDAVKIPRTAMDFKSIPAVYLQWYEEMFEQGKREAPPKLYKDPVVVQVDVKRISGTDNFEIKFLGKVPNKTKEIVSTNKMIRENRVYVHNGETVSELIPSPTGRLGVYFPRPVAKVMFNSTHMFPGVILQNLLGAWYASIPYQTGACAQIPLIPHIPSGARVIAAKAERQVLSVSYFHNGNYSRKTFVYDSHFKNCDVHEEKDISNLEPNFTVLENDICAYMNDKCELEIFHAKFSQSSKKKIVVDPVLDHDMKLFSDGVTTKFSREDQIYTIRLVDAHKLHH